MVKEAEVTQKKWLTSPRLCHIVGDLPLRCMTAIRHLRPVRAVRFEALPRARDISRPSFRVELIVASSPACQGLLSLLNERKLPRSVALEIMAFEGGA